MKRKSIVFICFMLIALSTSQVGFARYGGLDRYEGHRDNKNASGLATITIIVERHLHIYMDQVENAPIEMDMVGFTTAKVGITCLLMKY